MYLASTKTWYLERVVFLIAGLFTLLGLGIGYFLSPWGFVLNLLVGLNLVVFASIGFCPMAIFLVKCGIKPREQG